MKTTSWITVISLATSLCGCAGVKFYSDAELKHESGLKYYTAKPYLLIGPQKEGDQLELVRVIYLPDLAKPTYVKYYPGLGSHKFTLDVSEGGMLKNYGQESDTKITENLAPLLAATATLRTEALTTGKPTPFQLFEVTIAPDGTTGLKQVKPK